VGVEQFVFLVAGALIVGLAAHWIRTRATPANRLEGAIRRPGHRWQHGRLTVTPGVIAFESYRWQVRLRSGERRNLHVVRVDDWSGRRPSPHQFWSLNPSASIIELTTIDGAVAFAALPCRLRLVRTKLQVDKGSQTL